MKNLKCHLVALVAVFLSFSASAQVGIGTINPAAQLDIPASSQTSPSNTDGILIPRINAFPATNPTALQNGMMVFLTTTVGSNLPGFYYWNSSSWVSVGNSATNSWRLTGNAGTVATTNFLGTTDDIDVVFKRNSVKAGLIGGTVSYNTAFGNNSLTVPTAAGIKNTAVGNNALTLNTSGIENTAMGYLALYSNTQGRYNTAVGKSVLQSSTLGNSNTAIGYSAMGSNTTGGNNTAIGRQALNSNSTGDFNTALGFQSLFTGTAGTNNVAVGYESLYTTTGSGNVGLGFNAGRLETGSNKLYIENTNGDANNALVYGEFDNDILRINGQLQIGNQTTTGYKFPTTRGTVNQTLQTDATGTVTWVTPNNTLSVARANLNAGQGLSTAGWQKINFNTVAFDSNSEFGTGTNRFTATKAGYYEINAGFHTDAQSNSQFYSIGVYVNGALYQETSSNHFANGPVSRNINCMVNLAVGGYVEIFVQNYQSGVTIDSYSGKTFFEVKQIK